VNVLSIAKYYTKFEVAIASMVAEINRGSQNFWDAPYPGPLPIFIVKIVSRQATPQAQVVYQI